jgi:transcription elongation factor GreA
MVTSPCQGHDRGNGIHRVPQVRGGRSEHHDPADELLVTAEGYERLCSELEILRTERRPAMSERLREARADGDLEDNPALFDVLEEQAQLERRIAALEARLAAARIAEPTSGGRAGIGSSVVLRDLETSDQVEYELVGAIEADIGRGRLSMDAPVGRALLGASAGDALNVACPKGALRLEVISLRRAERPARESAW